MKHLRFESQESICGIERVRNEVFASDAHTLCVLDARRLNVIAQFIRDEVQLSGHRCIRLQIDTSSAYKKIILPPIYHFKCCIDSDEIILVRGYDRILVVDELGDLVSRDYDIDFDIK